MKKYILLLCCTIVFISCSNNNTAPVNMNNFNLPGAPVEAPINERGAIALDYLVKEKSLGDNYKLVNYEYQVVAGMNHFFTVDMDGTIIKYTVFESLNGEYSVTSEEEISDL